jgi:hypothetical protein
VDIQVEVGALEALVAMHVEQHVLEAGPAEKLRELAVLAEAVVEHHGHPRRFAVGADRIIGTLVIVLEHRRRHIPARLVQHLDAVQRGSGAVARREPSEQVDRMREIFRARVPFTDILDAAVVEAVLAPGRGVQVEQHAQPELGCPVEHAVHDVDAPFDERMASHAVLRMVGIWRPQDPMPDRQAHGVDADRSKPRDVLARDEAVPMGPQPGRSLASQLGAPCGLVGCLEPVEQARRHPLLEHQPAAEIDAAQADRGCRGVGLHRVRCRGLRVRPIDYGARATGWNTIATRRLSDAITRTRSRRRSARTPTPAPSATPSSAGCNAPRSSS